MSTARDRNRTLPLQRQQETTIGLRTRLSELQTSGWRDFMKLLQVPTSWGAACKSQNTKDTEAKFSKTDFGQLRSPPEPSKKTPSKGRASLVWLLCLSALFLSGSTGGRQTVSMLTPVQPDLPAVAAQNRAAQQLWLELHLTKELVQDLCQCQQSSRPRDLEPMNMLSIYALPFYFSAAGPASLLADTLNAANQCSIVEHHGGLIANCTCCHTHPFTCRLLLSQATNDSNITLHIVPDTSFPMADVPDMVNTQVHGLHQPLRKSFETHRPDSTRLPQPTSTIGIQHAHKCPQEALIWDTHTGYGTLNHTYHKVCMKLYANSHVNIMERPIPATISGVRCLCYLCQQPVSRACAGCCNFTMTLSSATDQSLSLNADARCVTFNPTTPYYEECKVCTYCCRVHDAATLISNYNCSPRPCLTTSLQLKHGHPSLGHPNAQSEPILDQDHAFWRTWDQSYMSPYMAILRQAVTMQDSLLKVLEATRLGMICLLQVEHTLTTNSGGGFCIYHGSGTFCDSIPALRAAGMGFGMPNPIPKYGNTLEVYQESQTYQRLVVLCLVYQKAC